MKIVDKTKDRKTVFEELKPGDVFKSLTTDRIYIKTIKFLDVNYNAVHLENGEFCKFGSDKEVILLQCELVITG